MRFAYVDFTKEIELLRKKFPLAIAIFVSVSKIKSDFVDYVVLEKISDDEIIWVGRFSAKIDENNIVKITGPCIMFLHNLNRYYLIWHNEDFVNWKMFYSLNDALFPDEVDKFKDMALDKFSQYKAHQNKHIIAALFTQEQKILIYYLNKWMKSNDIFSIQQPEIRVKEVEFIKKRWEIVDVNFDLWYSKVATVEEILNANKERILYLNETILNQFMNDLSEYKEATTTQSIVMDITQKINYVVGEILKEKFYEKKRAAFIELYNDTSEESWEEHKKNITPDTTNYFYAIKKLLAACAEKEIDIINCTIEEIVDKNNFHECFEEDDYKLFKDVKLDFIDSEQWNRVMDYCSKLCQNK